MRIYLNVLYPMFMGNAFCFNDKKSYFVDIGKCLGHIMRRSKYS